MMMCTMEITEDGGCLYGGYCEIVWRKGGYLMLNDELAFLHSVYSPNILNYNPAFCFRYIQNYNCSQKQLQMESKMTNVRFSYEGCCISTYGLFTLKGIIQGREVNIVISMTQDENSININLANQLFISEHNISEKTNIFCKRQYEIKDLQVTIDDYEYISQFNVTTMYREEIDIIIGLPWFKSLGTFILNIEKKFVTFPYKKKMMTLQDITMRSKSITPSSKDFKDISKVILPDNQNSISKMQKEYDEVIADKNQEISRLKNHSEKLLTQIKKSRDTKQRVQELEQENQDLGKKLSGNDEEASRLKNLNKKLLEQIKKMKDEKPENRNIINKVGKSEDEEEISRLRVHNQNLLTQIKKLKHDKKTLQEKLDRKTSLVDKETMTDPINLTTQKEANPADVKKFSNVEVQTSQRYEENSIPKVNQEKATSIRSKDQVARMPYRHPNHKSRYFNQSMYQQKQITAMSKNITSTTSAGQNRSYHGSRNVSSSFQEPYKNPNPQKIELGWADSFTIRQFCSALRRSYRLRSSTITNSIMKKHETIITS
jgi:hypothetical protein